jgi:aminoglycoside 3-N-acetyltransferase
VRNSPECWSIQQSVNQSRCRTALHLAEYAVAYPGRRRGRWHVPVSAVDRRTRWAAVDELLVWEGDFGAMGAAFEATQSAGVAMGRIGAADCRLVQLRDLVRFAGWLPEHRDLRQHGYPPGWLEVTEAPDPLSVSPLAGLHCVNEGVRPCRPL